MAISEKEKTHIATAHVLLHLISESAAHHLNPNPTHTGTSSLYVKTEAAIRRKLAKYEGAKK